MLITPTVVEICIQQLGRAEEMAFTTRRSYASAVLGVIILSVWRHPCAFRLIQRTYRWYFHTAWKGNSSSQMWFFVQLCSSWQDFNWLKGSRGLCSSWATCYIYAYFGTRQKVQKVQRQDRQTIQLILHIQDKHLAPAHVVFVMLWNSFSLMFSWSSVILKYGSQHFCDWMSLQWRRFL